jgi:integrase
VPLIGKLTAKDLTCAQVQRMVDGISAGRTAGHFRKGSVIEGGAGVAARTAELLGGIWSWAAKREFVSGPNPCRGIEKRAAVAKDRVLSPEEMMRLGAVLRDREDQAAATAVRLIALTGLRREEACGLRWQEIDWSSGCLRLEKTKTGRSMRPIGKTALRMLEALPPATTEWVFPNRTGTGSALFPTAIASLFDAARLPDARSHDLRRSFASIAADEGYSDSTIGELLGHVRLGVTSRHYIRRPDAVLVAAADKVSETIARMLDGKSGEVVPLAREGSR